MEYKRSQKRNKHAYYGMLFNPEKKNLKKLETNEKYRPFVECIKMYNMDYETYKKMKEAETVDMTFEEVYESIKAHYLKVGTKQGMKNGIEWEMRDGIEQGMEEKEKFIVTKMLKKNINIKEIMEITGLTEKEIQKYQEE